MSSRMTRYDDRSNRKGDSSYARKRKFNEIPELREKRSPRETHRHRGSTDRNARRRSRSKSRSRSRSRRARPDSKTERRHRESPRNKRKFREERENDEPKKSRKSPTPQESPTDDVVLCEEDTAINRMLAQPLFLLNERFSALSAGRPLVVEENVSVEIERKISGREKFVIPRVLEPKAVGIPKNALEGRGPLTLRDEFKGRFADFPSTHWRPEQKVGGRGLGRKFVQPMGNAKEDERRNRDNWNGSPTNRFNDQNVERQTGEEEDGSGLPDFSKRPGKYSYEAWKDKPELIPKGKNYFEHDVRNQGVVDQSQRRSFENRGGGQWSRGRVPRGRGAFNRTGSDMEVWKHDKFEELLAEESQGF